MVANSITPELLQFFREMDSSGISACAPDHMIGLSKSPLEDPREPEDNVPESTNLI